MTPHAETRLVGEAPRRHIWLSALTGAGVPVLEQEVLSIVGAQSATEDTFLARARHLVALKDAVGHLRVAAAHFATSPPPIELFAEELREAQHALGTITGEFTADDLLGVIFSRFCIGK